MFIQTETTPNPATLKFLPGRSVMAEGSLEIRDGAGAARSPLAQALFSVPGVAGVFFGPDFISVTKGDAEWQHMRPAILGIIMEHFTSGAPLLVGEDTGASDTSDEFFDEAHADTVATIKELLESRIRPAVASDGGDITFRGYKDGIVYLAMKGACSGCPSSTATLKSGIQNLFRHYLPEVQSVEQI